MVDPDESDTSGKVTFAYISKNHALGLLRCHLFQGEEATAIALSKAVSKAFKLAHSLLNPFNAPADQELVNPPASLVGSEIRRHFLTSTGVVGSGQFGEVHLGEPLPLAASLHNALLNNRCASI